MSNPSKLRALQDALAEAVLSATEAELREDVEDEGINAAKAAEEMRTLLFKTVKDFKQRALIAAKEQHRQKTSDIAARRFSLPSSAVERRQLLDAVIAQHQQAGTMLIAQHRDFKELTDEDVESWLQQFGVLGLLDSPSGTGS